ncbi:FecR domain-containing protein [Caulobacter sp. 73W]|uniref:FecR domain-containing protein n=1 Tax=Caulobacter sp. 73W TaxID=3161137 RepID=A0AB39KYG3_9CAUL
MDRPTDDLSAPGRDFNSAEAARAAARWLAALECGTADREAFEQWRAQDARHAAAFARLAGLWSDLDEAKTFGARPEPKPRAPDRRWFLTAASMGGIAVVGGLVAGQRAFGRERLSTAVGQRSDVTLPDGTRLGLNTDTRVAWRMSDGARRLWLERGEMSVRVGRNAAPCELAGEGDPIALAPGGLFNIRRRDETIELLVLQGRVAPTRLADAPLGARTLLKVGGVQSVSRAATEQELSAAAAWPHGELVFEDAPLSTAVAEYNRHLQRKLVIADAATGQIRIGGRFTSTDPSDFLHALSQSVGVVVQPSGDDLLLHRAK